MTQGFEVRVYFPMDNDFTENDKRLEVVAGPSDFAGAGLCEGASRDHGWNCKTFAEAHELKERIAAAFPEWTVNMRER